ncbi:hypothetical protein ACFQ49_06215 [Kroppenstedtia eburnea]|uniref:hypothetical protein n=1 Tax=Kroppenstedtia eburnea TaxID=714067 RepID=UPI003639FFEB
MERVTWKDPEDPVDDGVIEEIENKLGIRFPLDYITIATFWRKFARKRFNIVDQMLIVSETTWKSGWAQI